MTDLSHYRVGPTKTSDGDDAVIYAIYPGQHLPIHGAYRSKCGGFWIELSGRPGEVFLPNNLPVPVPRWLPPDGSLQVSDTPREGWTRVEVPMQPVRGKMVLIGRNLGGKSWGFNLTRCSSDTHRLTLPTDGGDPVCGEYHDAAGNVIKVERIND